MAERDEARGDEARESMESGATPPEKAAAHEGAGEDAVRGNEPATEGEFATSIADVVGREEMPLLAYPADPSEEELGASEVAASQVAEGAPKSDVPPLPPATFRSLVGGWLHDYFLGDEPSFFVALFPCSLLSMILFTRNPIKTNFIFDEQEALLANPYVRSVSDPQSKLHWLDAFYRDFWGLGPERSIGSYRPIPDLVWRALWGLGARKSFFHDWVNVVLHGVNGALVVMLAYALTKRRGVAWIAGLTFTASAVLTEAVSGVVGIADVLGAMGAILALLALTMKLPWMAIGVFAATLFGLYSKESVLCCVPLVPLGALLLAPITHPQRPWRWARAAAAFVAAAAAFVLYVTLRRRMFPVTLPPELSVEASAGKPLGARVFAAILRWYAQPALPKDPLNNPLVNADSVHRITGALRVWFRGLVQVVFPITLSGDYSAPQEPIPDLHWSLKLVSNPKLFLTRSWEFIEIGLGALAVIAPFPIAAYLGIRAWWRRRRGITSNTSLIVAFSLLWVVLSFFPVSNIPILLPTIRAERFWYFPVIGTSLLVAIMFGWLADRTQPGTPRRKVVIAYAVAFFALQCFSARKHALDYSDDLAFWDATRKAVPRSAKAHLNYSVMKGARGDLPARLEANGVALDLAPEWPMASIYYGDTLCRMHRAPEAWPHYKRGFELAPNDTNLIALALQCMWDEKLLDEASPVRAEFETELDTMKEQHPNSWLDFLGRDILEKGTEHGGVDKKYRPRGYDEGPKD